MQKIFQPERPTVAASLVQRVRTAASTLRIIGDTSSIPYIKVVAGASLFIVEIIQAQKAIKEDTRALIERIDQLLAILTELCLKIPIQVPPALLEAMGRFAQTLQKIASYLRVQQDSGRFKLFFQQQENAARLAECHKGLDEATQAFTMHTSLAAIQNLTQIMPGDAEQRQVELLKLISDSSSMSDSAGSSSLTDRLTAMSSIMPPGPPQIFHGRQLELNIIVDQLLQDSPRIALLGPGGIGKTSLAKAAIHNPDVVAKFPDRYFVSCDSAESVDDLVLAVAAVLGLELKGRLSRAVVKSLESKPNCLLVLDNFETPWEPIGTRLKVEEFISLLADMPNVALLVTMRGQERPSSIRWTRPFIPPLEPLSSDAAHSTFMDISDPTDEDATYIPELLSLSGNLPLAVTLVASVALYEGCQTVLSRWKADSSMSPLSDGFDKHTSLETSLRISLSSPRMTSRPGALQLLSLLSLLPDGISDIDLTRHALPIPELYQSKSTLLGTSLAYMDANATRLKVLAPVREIIKKLHPPAHALLSPLRTHWDGLLQLWKTYKMPSGDLVSRLVENLGNFSTVLKYEVEISRGGELKDAVYGVLDLEGFLRQLHGASHLLADMSGYVDRAGDDHLHGFYIVHRLDGTQNIEPEEALELTESGCRFARLGNDAKLEAQILRSAALYNIRRGEVENHIKYSEAAISVSENASDDLGLTMALNMYSTGKRLRGDFKTALAAARRAQWVAGRTGNFEHETNAMVEEAQALIELGYYAEGAEICARAEELVIAGGYEGTPTHVIILDIQADIQLKQDAYADSRKTCQLILRYTSLEKSARFYANTLLNIAALDVTLGAFESMQQVQAALEIPRQVFNAHGYLRGLPKCDKVVADYLLLAEGQRVEAAEMYDRVVRATRGKDEETFPGCMRKLGDLELWPGQVQCVTRWAVTFLAYGKTTGSVPSIVRAFRLLGDILRYEGDEQTAEVLFRISLDEFTRMGIVGGRDECLLRLGVGGEKTEVGTI